MYKLKKIPDHGKYITIQEFNDRKLKQAILASKNYIADFVKKRDSDEKLMNVDKTKWSIERS